MACTAWPWHWLHGIHYKNLCDMVAAGKVDSTADSIQNHQRRARTPYAAGKHLHAYV